MFATLFAILPLLALTSASPIVKRQNSVLIESGRNAGQCLSIQGGRQAVQEGKITNDTPVVTLACAVASFWDISKGSGSVVASGTNYALDLGLYPTNNGNVKVWTSYPTAPQQTWYLTDDNRIAQTGGTQCLDQGDNGPQTYQCTTGNTNQVWNVRFGDLPPSPSTTTVTPPAPSSSPMVGVLIESFRSTGANLCLSVLGGKAAVAAGTIGNETPVFTVACTEASLWDISKGSGSVIVSGTNFALDLGLYPNDHGNVKIYQSFPGAKQQTWYLTDDARIAQTGGTQCLDQGDNGPQTYTCTTGNTNQIWNVRFLPAAPSTVPATTAPATTAPATTAPATTAPATTAPATTAPATTAPATTAPATTAPATTAAATTTV